MRKKLYPIIVKYKKKIASRKKKIIKTHCGVVEQCLLGLLVLRLEKKWWDG